MQATVRNGRKFQWLVALLLLAIGLCSFAAYLNVGLGNRNTTWPIYVQSFVVLFGQPGQWTWGVFGLVAFLCTIASVVWIFFLTILTLGARTTEPPARDATDFGHAPGLNGVKKSIP